MNIFHAKGMKHHEWTFSCLSDTNLNKKQDETCNNNNKDILHFQQWIAHGIWTSRNLIKLCGKTIKKFVKNSSFRDCGLLEQKSCDCKEMLEAYSLLYNSILTLQNILSFINCNAYDWNTDLKNSSIESIQAIIDFINVVKYSTYNCKHFKMYLSGNNNKCYGDIIHQLFSALEHLSGIYETRCTCLLSGIIDRDVINLALKLEYIQRMSFFRKDLLTLALELENNEGNSEFNSITLSLLSYIETMLTFENDRYCCNIDYQTNNKSSNCKSFIEFLFDGKLIDFIIKCAHSYDGDNWNSSCLIYFTGMKCISIILQIITHKNYKHKGRGFRYICKLFDKKQLNILPIIVKSLKIEVDAAAGYSTHINKYRIKTSALDCIASVIQYQIGHLTIENVANHKLKQKKSYISDYCYPYSPKFPTLQRNVEFIDKSIQQVAHEQIDTISKEDEYDYAVSLYKFEKDNLHYDLKFYELIRVTDGTPNDTIISAIKSMNREWTLENTIKLYQQYFDPCLKLMDFLNEYPWVFCFSLNIMFDKCISEKKWNKAASMLETIDKSMRQTVAVIDIEINGNRKDWVIIHELMTIARKKQEKVRDKEPFLVSMKDKREVYMLNKLVKHIKVIRKVYNSDHDKLSEYIYHIDDIYLINKIQLVLKQMAINWLPKLLTLSPNDIANNTNGAWAVQDATLFCAEMFVTQNLINIENINENKKNKMCLKFAIWHKIVKKGCYFVLKNEWGSANYLSRLWRANGILNFYHLLQSDLNSFDCNNKIKIQSTIYCFRQVLKFSQSSFDKMECIQLLLLLHVLNGNMGAVSKFEHKISKRSKLHFLQTWIQEMMVKLQNYSDASNPKAKIYIFMQHILNHNHVGINDTSISDVCSIENEFMTSLESKVSSDMETIASSEFNVITMCNVMQNKQCNWEKCHQRSKKLKKCKKCKLAFYCSKSCQKHDWKLHKTSCKRNPIVTFG